MVDNGTELTTTMFLKTFNAFRIRGREINLETYPDITSAEIAPDEQAIFCLSTGPITTMVYVCTEKSFEYYKKMMDILLVVPKRLLTLPISATPHSLFKGSGSHRPRKKHHNPNRFWHVTCFG